jgi:Galactosyltransferase
MRRATTVTVLRAFRSHRQNTSIIRLIVALSLITSLFSLMFIIEVNVKWKQASILSRSLLCSVASINLTLCSERSMIGGNLADDDLLPTTGDDDVTISINTSLPIIHRHPFDYVINCPDICGAGVGSDEILLLNYVHSAVDHFDRRDQIRRTWGNESNFRILRFANNTIRLRVRTVFFVGLSPNKPFLQTAIETESRLFSDIIQETFHDTYR